MEESALEDPEYPIHPLAVRMPLLSDREYRTLKHSIEHHGQQHPIELLKGYLLDGRHRICVGRELGIPIKTVEVDIAEDEVWHYTAAKAAVRSMTATQKALLALELLPECERRAAERRYGGVKVRQGERGKAAALAASLVRVSPTYVEQAKKLQKDDPALFERVLRGELHMSGAYREAEGKARRVRKGNNKEVHRIPVSDSMWQDLITFANSTGGDTAREAIEAMVQFIKAYASAAWQEWSAAQKEATR
jgi:hypothetical protein